MSAHTNSVKAALQVRHTQKQMQMELEHSVYRRQKCSSKHTNTSQFNWLKEIIRFRVC